MRGEDSSFPIKFTNPLDYNLKNIDLGVEGLLSSYLLLGQKHIAFLDVNKEFVTTIEIISPKYFNPGKYNLVFTIKGVAVYGGGREVVFVEKKELSLFIHDTNRETAAGLLVEMGGFVEELRRNNFKVNNLPVLFLDANVLFLENDFDGVKEKYLLAKSVFDDALSAAARSQSVSGLIGLADGSGVDTPNTDRLLALAQLAFKRGDYALALARLKEAELTYATETKGEFNLLIWVLGNLDRVVLMFVLFVLAWNLFFAGVRLISINRNLKSFGTENSLLLTLIAGLQKKTFVENKLSLSEYYDSLSQFERRIAEVSEGIIELTTRRVNMLNFSGPSTQLRMERRTLVDLVRDTQKQYFTSGLIETRMYQTRVGSITKRVAEVDEKIVSSDLRKTIRINSVGPLKYLWRLYYTIIK